MIVVQRAAGKARRPLLLLLQMFRTRDFVLIFVTIVFLLVAIGVTVLKQDSNSIATNKSLLLVDNLDKEYSAAVDISSSLSREDRLVAMRKKIADGGEIFISAPEPAVEEDAEVEEVSVEQEPVAVQQCPGYREFSDLWKVDGILFDVVEGYRILYREVESIPVYNASGTSYTGDTKREVLLQLPVRIAPTSNVSCLSTNVVGVAQDGSLIRNNETGLYGVFGSNTLVGYALDGFPIFGVSNRPSDKCGGHMENGQYGYYLSDERDVILNCFSATPTSI